MIEKPYNSKIIYSGTSLKRTLTVPDILSALERCAPWRGLAYFDKNLEKTLLQDRKPIK